MPTLSFGEANSETQVQCESDSVCVHPGDSLTYMIHFGLTNSSEIFDFGDMVDNDHIRLVEKFVMDQNQTENNTIILNVRTGFGHLDQQGSPEVPFLTVLPTPIQYNMTNFSVTNEYVDFNGHKRTALSAIQGGGNITSTLEYDKDTGILLNAHSVGIANIDNKSVLIEYTSNLVNTNVINSDSKELQSSTTESASIPNWIRHNAKWWSDGTIDDSEFIKSIQFLISNGIMQIPHNDLISPSTSQQIPSWVKNNAKFWSDGSISDDEFISGIQYLVNSGIIKV